VHSATKCGEILTWTQPQINFIWTHTHKWKKIKKE